MRASSHCWQGQGPDLPVASKGKGGRLELSLVPFFAYPALSSCALKKTDLGGTWTLLPVGVLGKAWNVSFGWSCERQCSS